MTRAFAAVLILGLATVARADDGGAGENDVELAKAHFNTGQIDYDKGRFADAAHEFEEAYRLSGRAPLLYNVGKSYDGASDFARALGAYRRFLATTPESADKRFAESRVQLLETLVGKIAVAEAVEGSSVILDGTTMGKTPVDALLVNPGRHTVELQHEGYANFKSALDVPVGGTTTLTAKQVELIKVVRVAEPQKERTPVYKKWWVWTAVGGAVVVAGVITAVVLTTKSSSGGLDVTLPAVR